MKHSKCTLSAILILLTIRHATDGQDYFFDTFQDGDVRDGVPVEWHNSWGGQLAAEDGHLHLSGDATHLAVPISIGPQPGWSVQARASLDGPGIYVGVGILFDSGNVWLGFRPNGSLEVGTPGVTMGRTDTDLIVDDVMVRLDAFDGTLQAWAWEPGDDMPEEPMVVVETPIRNGRPGVWMEGTDLATLARFDFFEAATTPLPDQLVYGDFDFDRVVDASDVDVMSSAIRSGQFDTEMDLTNDELLDGLDRDFWVTWVKQTWFGDANLDGRFDNLDLVEVLQAGEYMDAITGNSTWATGDWNGDGEFNARDLVKALQDGGYGQGPRLAAMGQLPSPAAAVQVPEPSTVGLLMVGVLLQLTVMHCRSRCRRVV